MENLVIPYSLKDAPALIERLLPVQKLSAEVYKERKAGPGQTLVPLGSYWKGRKPLILNKACILGCLLPATDNYKRDLEIFEMLMAMDDESFIIRWPHRYSPKEILATIPISCINDFFLVEPKDILPKSAPINWSKPEYKDVKVVWREDISLFERRKIEAQMLPKITYRQRVDLAKRPEEVMSSVHDHIWDNVNTHLGTEAHSIPELVEQLGIMRFGNRPRVADTFCGSGQIPYEAARMGCNVYASDLNPIACMLTWGAFNIVGGSLSYRKKIKHQQEELVSKVVTEIDNLGVETDGNGWRAKAYLYCLEVRCPQSGWLVPLMTSRILSFSKQAIIELIPIADKKRYEIRIRAGVTLEEIKEAAKGTIRNDGRGQDPYFIHRVNGVEYKTKIATLRGDYKRPDNSIGNKLRLWEKSDFKPHKDDIFQERLYAIQWMRPKEKNKGFEYEFRSVTEEDLVREHKVEAFIEAHLSDWQEKGWIPDMHIEAGLETTRLFRERGWTYWHHLFPPRHLLILGLIKQYCDNGSMMLLLSRILNYTSKLCIWSTSKPGSKRPGEGGRTGGGSDNPVNVFYNQALNTLFNYGCRASIPLLEMFDLETKSLPCANDLVIQCHSASDIAKQSDIFITDPPYGDAVSYDEIFEFFISWLRKNSAPEFDGWVWDSRRSLAIKGEDEKFRRDMVTAYKQMSKCMSDNGMQIIMFTHQSISIWADMANIVWASDLQVTAAWNVVTETDNALRDGSYVKGTVLLVLRKRYGKCKTTSDDLAWEIQEEVERQVHLLTGLNQEAKGIYRNENIFEDQDIQMAGYAAALRVLTQYAIIDGHDMTIEAIRPRVKGESNFVDNLITFAADTANQCLVPQGITKVNWDKLSGAERFYLKLLDLEARGFKKLDNYQNFAKVFKVRDFRTFMASQKANDARLKNSLEFGRAEMSEGSELYKSVLRSILYALMEIIKNMDSSDVLIHLSHNVTDFFNDMTQRDLVVELADYIAIRLDVFRPEEASAARVLRELVKNQRLG